MRATLLDFFGSVFLLLKLLWSAKNSEGRKTSGASGKAENERKFVLNELKSLTFADECNVIIALDGGF